MSKKITTAMRIMNAGYELGNATDVTSSYNLTVESFEDIKSGFIDAKYPGFLWNQVIDAAAIDTSINVGARKASYRVRDKSGMGAFVNTVGSNIPTVETGLGKVEVPIELAAVSDVVTLDEAREVSFGHSVNLITDHGEVMREAAERHVERTFFFGSDSVNFRGFLDYPFTPSTTASTKAAGGTEWVNATGDEIAFDVNNAISTIWVNTRQIALAGSVYLPSSQYALIATKRISESTDGTAQTVMQFLKMNNVYTAKTGIPLDIFPLHYLDEQGVGDTDRMIVKVKDPANDWLPFPELFNVLPPQLEGLNTRLYATYTFGSYHNRFPLEAVYVDGI